MTQILDPLLIAAMAVNFYLLGVSRIRAAINAVALQGVLLGVLPLFVHLHFGVRSLLLVAGTVFLKGFAIPALLFRAVREAEIQHEISPFIGFVGSIILGAIGAGLALEFAATLPLAASDTGSLLVPVSLATVWTGFLLLTTRKLAILQVVGYLVLENGVFLFGLLLLEAIPFLVEVGVLLDVFTGVFIMGIIIFHINRGFASSGMEKLSELKE